MQKQNVNANINMYKLLSIKSNEKGQIANSTLAKWHKAQSVKKPLNEWQQEQVS